MNFLKSVWGRLKKAKAFVVAQTKVSDRFFWLSAVLGVVAVVWLCQIYGIYIADIWFWAGDELGPLGHLGLIVLAGLISWAVTYTALRSIWIITDNHYGVRRESVFASRNNKVVKNGRDGLWFAVPFLERMIFISRKPGDIEVVATVNLKDRLPLNVTLNILIEPDSEVVNERGQNVFALFIAEDGAEEAEGGADEVIPSGLKKAAMATAEEVCAHIKDFSQLNDMRSAVRDIFASKFALAKMPHESHNPAKCGIVGCKMKPGKELGMGDLPEFYATHYIATDRRLDKKKGQSKFERLFGVKVKRVTCTIDPNDETNKAFAERQKASAIAEANKYAMEMFDELVKRGVSHEVALNHIQISLHKELIENKQIISVEGLDRIIEGLRTVAKTIIAP